MMSRRDLMSLHPRPPGGWGSTAFCEREENMVKCCHLLFMRAVGRVGCAHWKEWFSSTMPTIPALDVICGMRLVVISECVEINKYEGRVRRTKVMSERKTRIERRWPQIASVRSVMMTLFCYIGCWSVTTARWGGWGVERANADVLSAMNSPNATAPMCVCAR